MVLRRPREATPMTRPQSDCGIVEIDIPRTESRPKAGSAT